MENDDSGLIENDVLNIENTSPLEDSGSSEYSTEYCKENNSSSQVTNHSVVSNHNVAIPRSDEDEPATTSGVISNHQHNEGNIDSWTFNYHEACIFLQEGENNEKFTSHPGTFDDLPAYLVTHNLWFYFLDFLASFVLLCLALIEPPGIEGIVLSPIIHVSIEILCLLIILLELLMRIKWLGPKLFFTHIRTVIKGITLVIMFVEAITVLARQKSHFRVTRALRPIFILDCYKSRGVRRFIRQVIQSMPPILDMLGLLIFFLLIFSLFGFYLFSSVPDDQNFQSLEQSFISLFVLLTTANFPDLMMPAYAQNKLSALFFITFLSLELYFMMNLLLAVVYDAFSNEEKCKLKKLWLHKRAACGHSYKLLVTKLNPNRIYLKQFSGLMKYYKPNFDKTTVYLIFKHLNKSESGSLSLEEFYNVFAACRLYWHIYRGDHAIWSTYFSHPFNVIFKGLNTLAKSKIFEATVYFVISFNFLWILIDTSILSKKIKDKDHDPIVNHLKADWETIACATFYAVEVLIKLLGLGPSQYFSSGWNNFDFTITFLAVIGLIMQMLNSHFYYFTILRPFRLLRLFKMKRRYRDVFGTFFILFKRLLSLAVVILLLYYFFSILGIEIFSGLDLKNCCINSTVEDNYKYDNTTNQYGYYYLNNFDSIFNSYLTLFELTVINNWHIIMEGYAVVYSQWSRIYFMIFYIITMVLMAVIVSFILEAFLFRMQYRTKMKGHDMDDDAIIRIEVKLSPEEMRMCQTINTSFSGHYIQSQASYNQSPLSEEEDVLARRWIKFKGERVRGRQDFSLRMYEDEVQDWLREDMFTQVSSSEAELREIQPMFNQ